MNSLVPWAPTSELYDAARAFSRASLASASLRAYKSAWEMFSAFCTERGFRSLPAAPETVALYITDMAKSLERADITVVKHLAAISYVHKQASLAQPNVPGLSPSPSRSALVQSVLSGIRRAGTRQVQHKTPATRNIIEALVGQIDRSTLQGLRDAAAILVGYVGAFRPSEVVALRLEDVRFTPDGAEILLRKSKIDQEAKGYWKGIPFGEDEMLCPVLALRAWIDSAHLPAGRLFPMSARALSRLIKRHAQEAGLDPALYSGHSLRAGYATEALRQGVDSIVVAKQTGHRNVNSLRDYYQDDSINRGGAKRVI